MTESERDDQADGATGDSDSAEDAGQSEDRVDSLRKEQLEMVRETDEEDLAEELASRDMEIERLHEEIDELEATVEAQDAEIEDLTSRLKRNQADFQNYKKRIEKQREEEKKRATEDLVERLLDVRDNLKRALDQDDPEALREGVESTLRQFETELDRENVDPIEPNPGDEVDPEHHEVLAKINADQPDGAIADVHRPGYVMGEKVLRPAQVAVSDGPTENRVDSDATTDGDANDIDQE
ncbi:MAG: nucleotide exchange factor GrpE [Halorhabdus sp.]